MEGVDGVFGTLKSYLLETSVIEAHSEEDEELRERYWVFSSTWEDFVYTGS